MMPYAPYANDVAQELLRTAWGQNFTFRTLNESQLC
jgi:hypothetical protein